MEALNHYEEIIRFQSGPALVIDRHCQLAGVSTATVSRALNGHPNVREETRLRIERIADEWGYLPSAAARSLSRSKNDIIGFILPQVESGFYASLLAGIDEASRARGYHLITALSHGDHRELHPGIRLLRERRIDGLLLLEPSIDRHDIARVKSAHMPFVLLQRPPVGDLPTVRIDDEGGGYLMGATSSNAVRSVCWWRRGPNTARTPKPLGRISSRFGRE